MGGMGPRRVGDRVTLSGMATSWAAGKQKLKKAASIAGRRLGTVWCRICAKFRAKTSSCGWWILSDHRG